LKKYLELVLQQIFLVGQLAIKTEELSFFGGHFLNFASAHMRCGLHYAGSSKTFISGGQTVLELPVTYAQVHLILLVRVHDGGWCGWSRRVCE